MVKNKSKINIITGVTPGLINDAIVLKNILSGLGYKTTIQAKSETSINPKKRYPLIWHKIQKYFFGKSAINFHIEIMRATWSEQAKINAWIPNPECVADEIMRLGSASDWILCKTRNTESLLKDYFNNLEYVGFTSIDRHDPVYIKKYNKFLHVMGQSHFKGTRTLVDVWSNHPEWPELDIVATETPWNNIEWLRLVNCPNIRLLEGPLPEKDIIKLLNTCGVHICPSEAEGFGHYIVEALSAKSIVLTTNAPPMNELIDRTHGFLAEYDIVESKNMGTLYKVTKGSLERNIQNIISLDEDELKRMSECSRKRYDKITENFVLRLKNWLNEVKS